MKKMIVVLAMGMMLNGCATVYHGTTQDVQITTHPAGLTAELSGKTCITPCKLEGVSRKDTKLTLKSATGEPYYFDVDRDFNTGAAVLGNWWNYVAIGLVIDITNGSAYEIKPINIRIDTLAAKGASNE